MSVSLVTKYDDYYALQHRTVQIATPLCTHVSSPETSPNPAIASRLPRTNLFSNYVLHTPPYAPLSLTTTSSRYIPSPHPAP